MAIRSSKMSLLQKYSAYNRLLKRICIEETKDSAVDFTSLYSRLYAIGRHYHFSVLHIDTFRFRSRRILNGTQTVDVGLFKQDEMAVADFIEKLSGIKLPFEIVLQSKSAAFDANVLLQHYRVVVSRIEKQTIYVHCENNSLLLSVEAERFPEVLEALNVGTQLNVMGAIDEKGKMTPQIIILEPDYLIDVSSLAACFQPQGSHPFNYLIQKLSPRRVTMAQLLGDAANQFMDDCIHEKENTLVAFKESIRKAFRQNLLGYLSISSEITPEFFVKARMQFKNIQKTIREKFVSHDVLIRPSEVVLEPSFICEALGLRGRFDVLTMGKADEAYKVVELKSGRADDYRQTPSPRKAHAVQMALYKEILVHNYSLQREQIKTYLLYSHYPILNDCRVPFSTILSALQLRNKIVAQEKKLVFTEFTHWGKQITLEMLNENNLSGKLYNNYIYPQEVSFFTQFTEASLVERAYFDAFMSFLTREQIFAKLGDGKPDSERGFSNVWNQNLTEKLQTGNIINHLTLQPFDTTQPVSILTFNRQQLTEEYPSNLNVGEMVQLYACQHTSDQVTSQQLFRGVIEKMDSDTLIFRLNTIQRNASVFPCNVTYAIEPDYTDSTFSSSFKGLFHLFSVSKNRRDLLLGKRQPLINPYLELKGSYLNKTINQIILAAKQALDFYLLIGPPGSGKTSIALRSMVQEFQLTHTVDGENLLLTAYTNRAVDEICCMLEKLDVPFVRIGNENTCNIAYRKYLFENQTINIFSREALSAWFVSQHIVVGTVATLSARQELFAIKTFHTAIIDEASQLLEPQLLGLLTATDKKNNCAIGKFILVGDPKQLPAVVLQNETYTKVTKPLLNDIGLQDLSESLFQRLQRTLKKLGVEGCMGQLSVQGRMHSEIAQFVNKEFYENDLSTVPNSFQNEPLRLEILADVFSQFLASQRLGFIDVDMNDYLPNPKSNFIEAKVVSLCVMNLIKIYSHSKCSINVSDIGIIVPFRNQITTIRAALTQAGFQHAEELTIDTVECYQGSQREIILYATTISRPYQLSILSNPKDVAGVLVDRKLNVALTRARKQCFVLGNARLLEKSPIYKRLLEEVPIFSCKEKLNL